MARSRDNWYQQQARYQREMQREVDREQRQFAAADRAATKQAVQDHIATEIDRADRATAKLDADVQVLQNILSEGLRRSPKLNLEARRVRSEVIPLDLGVDAYPGKAPRWDEFAPKSLNVITKCFGGEARYKKRLQRAESTFREAQLAHDSLEIERQTRVKKRRVNNLGGLFRRLYRR